MTEPDDAQLREGLRAVQALPCRSGKHKHETKAAARGQGFSLARNRGEKGRLSAYQCDWCGWWHVGRR